jgi:hypothetical protein
MKKQIIFLIVGFLIVATSSEDSGLFLSLYTQLVIGWLTILYAVYLSFKKSKVKVISIIVIVISSVLTFYKVSSLFDSEKNENWTAKKKYNFILNDESKGYIKFKSSSSSENILIALEKQKGIAFDSIELYKNSSKLSKKILGNYLYSQNEHLLHGSTETNYYHNMKDYLIPLDTIVIGYSFPKNKDALNFKNKDVIVINFYYDSIKKTGIVKF